MCTIECQAKYFPTPPGILKIVHLVLALVILLVWQIGYGGINFLFQGNGVYSLWSCTVFFFVIGSIVVLVIFGIVKEAPTHATWKLVWFIYFIVAAVFYCITCLWAIIYLVLNFDRIRYVIIFIIALIITIINCVLYILAIIWNRGGKV